MEDGLEHQLAALAEKYTSGENAYLLADDILELPAIALALQGKGPRRCDCCRSAADYLECRQCVRESMIDD